MPRDRPMSPAEQELFDEASMYLKMFSDTARAIYMRYVPTNRFELNNGLTGPFRYIRRYAEADAFLRAVKRYCNRPDRDTPAVIQEGMTTEETMRLRAMMIRIEAYRLTHDWPGTVHYRGPRSPTESGIPRRPFRYDSIKSSSGNSSSNYQTRSFSNIERLEKFFEKRMQNCMTIERAQEFKALEKRLWRLVGHTEDGKPQWHNFGSLSWTHENFTKPIQNYCIWKTIYPEKTSKAYRFSTFEAFEEAVLEYERELDQIWGPR